MTCAAAPAIARVRAGLGRCARVVALVAAAAMLAAGCGDGRLSKNEYITQSNKIQENASATMNKLGSAGTKQAEAKRLVKEFDKAIDQTEALKPPTEWQKHHDAIVKSMKSLRDALKIMSQAKMGDVKTATAQYATVTEAQQRYQQAITAINADR